MLAILVLFEEYLDKFRLNLLPFILSASLNTMRFVGTFSIALDLNVRLIIIEELRNYKKIVFT